jgi:IclR family transcriptional regulator, mhp operon transcriptional activator
VQAQSARVPLGGTLVLSIAMIENFQTRSLHRGLDILDCLSRAPASLHELHKGTGLPKSTLRRLLATMVERRYIRRGLSDGIYRTNIAIPGGAPAGLTVRYAGLVEAARPHMIALTAEVKWPSDLHVYHAGRMLILESTHGLSPFPTKKTAGPDLELNMFAAASGLAFLAASGSEFMAQVIEQVHDHEVWSPARFGLTTQILKREIREVRQRGFAVRRVTQTNEDGRNAIAVPVYEDKQPVGALTISWRKELMQPIDFAKRHLDSLKRAADLITSSRSRGDL